MYRVRCNRPTSEPGLNLFGVTGIVYETEETMKNPNFIATFYPDNMKPCYRSNCYVKYLEILDGKDDN